MADVPSTGAAPAVSTQTSTPTYASPAAAQAESISSLAKTGNPLFELNPAKVQESTDPVEAQVQAENPTATKAEVKKVAQLRKLKLKVDGEEIEESFNPDDNDYLTKQLQMAKVSQKRMQEAAQLRKQVQNIEQYLAQAKGDPKKLRAMLKDMGADEKALAASIIDEEISNSQKTPEQLEREKLQTELQKLREDNEKKDNEYKAKEFERLQAQEYERYDVQISKTLETAGVPKQPYVIKKMADYMLTGLQNGINLTPDEIMPLVKEEMANDIREMLAVAPDEFVESLIGKDVFSRMRKKNLAAAKAKPAQPIRSAIKDTGKTKEKEVTEPIKKDTFRSFFGV